MLGVPAPKPTGKSGGVAPRIYRWVLGLGGAVWTLQIDDFRVGSVLFDSERSYWRSSVRLRAQAHTQALPDVCDDDAVPFASFLPILPTS